MSETTQKTLKHDVLVVGGGTGGLSVTATLLRRQPHLDVAVVEPSEDHYYQPGWTLVGGGEMAAQATHRRQADVMPHGATWIKQAAASFQPDSNQVTLDSGDCVVYKYLVVAAGLQLDWDKIDGLSETLGKNGVTSNYRYDLAPYTNELVNAFTGGNALFTQPAMPIKCAGAPQKALYLSADTFRKRGIKANVGFYLQGGAMFGVPAYSKALDKVIADYAATPYFKHELVAVNGPAHEATFKTEDGNVTRKFDMLHVVPPQSAPDFIKSSPLASDAGWISVNKNSLRHTQYENVWGLGDCTNSPNSKTMAAVRRQYPVVVGGVLKALKQTNKQPSYDGYASCPLTTSHGKVMLAEFRYGGEVLSSFPLDPRVPRRLYWWMKCNLFPWLYWNVMLNGRDLRWPVAKPQPKLTP